MSSIEREDAAVSLLFRPVDGMLVVKPLILEELLSLKIIGMPDAVNTSTAPSVERFQENQLPALPGQMAAGSLALPVATSS